MHRLRHWLRWQPIVVISEWRNGDLWVGAKCTICGQIDSWTQVPLR